MKKMLSMPRRKLFIAILLCGVPLAATGTAQPSAVAIPVTSCQLENHPGVYDKKLVEVSGRIYYGKFDFVIDSDCKQHSQAGVWLDFGGDLQAPGEYWGISSSLPKQKGRDVEVRGVAIPLIRDAQLDLLINDVGATRFRKPNGDNCGSECLFYEVTATVKGRFFSAAKGGFGMEQCCHLLVIEKVLHVSFKRTRVPAGGEFHCTSDRWQPSPEEWKALSALPACSLREDFKNCAAAFARHWGDKINVNDRLDYPGGWMSPDMTLSYRMAGGFIQEPGQPMEIKPSSSVTREVCHAVSAPHPASEHVYCDFRSSGLIEDRDAAIALQKTVAAGSAPWRFSDMVQVGWLAYQDSARQWKLTVEPLRSAGCEQGTMAGSNQPWAQCTWLAADDLREVIVNLHKPEYLKQSAGNFDKVLWVATDVEANLCRTEPQQP